MVPSRADIVEGSVRVLAKPKEAVPPHSILNIGDHQPAQVIDFIATLEQVLGVRWSASRRRRRWYRR